LVAIELLRLLYILQCSSAARR